MNKVKVGFIGVGGMAEHHMKTLQKLEHAEISAVYDIDSFRMRQVADQYHAVPYGNAEQLIESAGIDALFICTPPFARGNLEELAARKGIHLLVEKPVGLNMEEVRRKERVLRDSGIIHTSGYCLRYLDTVQKAKRYLADKEIHMVLAYRIGGLPNAAWWRVMEKSGGQLVEQSTHQIDLIRYLAGEFKEMHAYYAHRHLHRVDPEATAYDVGIVSFTTESGALGTISNTCLSPRIGRGSVEFFGNDFYVAVDGKSLRIVDDEQEITETSETDFYLEQDKTFIEAVRTGRKELLLGDYSEAAATLAATLAANRSAETGRAVTVSEV